MAGWFKLLLSKLSIWFSFCCTTAWTLRSMLWLFQSQNVKVRINIYVQVAEVISEQVESVHALLVYRCQWFGARFLHSIIVQHVCNTALWGQFMRVTFTTLNTDVTVCYAKCWHAWFWISIHEYWADLIGARESQSLISTAYWFWVAEPVFKPFTFYLFISLNNFIVEPLHGLHEVCLVEDEEFFYFIFM